MSALLARASEYLATIQVGDAVRDVKLDRADDEVVLTIAFDHWKLPADLDYLDPTLARAYHFGEEERDDIDFMVALATDLDARTIVDFGCGTGQLAVALAKGSRRIIAIDPAKAMLDLARERDGADAVEWIWGDASALTTADVDLAVMLGNIPSAHNTDEAWDNSIRALHTCLRPGGRLAFGSWNPTALPWERRGTWDGMVVEPVGEGVRVGAAGAGRGTDLADGRERLWSPSVWRYRTEHEFTASLTRAGFVVERVQGDWAGAPLTGESG
ncbi:MAG TPA: class I SAM-dependent methyltransferase [Candidatus Dormibacteraeota bacterium]|nr:class I SAM-dependent methyltransferase [Candidatus Dormibacteraeota bacterium]